MQEEATEAESMWIKLSSAHSSHLLFLHVTCHPPGFNPKPTLNYLNDSMSRITSCHPRSNIVSGGDCNRITMADLEMDFELTTLNTPPTRGEANLDLILTNRPDQILNASCFVPARSLTIEPSW